MNSGDAMMDLIDLAYWIPVSQINNIGLRRSLLMSKHMAKMMDQWENESQSLKSGIDTENSDFDENNDNSSEPGQVVGACLDSDLQLRDVTPQGAIPRENQHDIDTQREPGYQMLFSDSRILPLREVSADETEQGQHETDSSIGDNVSESNTECLSCSTFPRVHYPWCLAHKCSFTETNGLGLNIHMPCAYNSIHGGTQCPSYLPPGWAEDNRNQRPVMQVPNHDAPQSIQPCQDARYITKRTETVHGGLDSWKAITACTNKGSEKVERSNQVDAKELEDHTAELKLFLNLMVQSKDLETMMLEDDEC